MTPNNRHLPPFGTELAARQRFGNLPSLVYVFAGQGAWVRAKHEHTRRGDCCPLIWTGDPPEILRWPVKSCDCVIEIGAGPSGLQVYGLALELLLAGASGVLAWWLPWNEFRQVLWTPDGAARELTAAEILGTVWPSAEEAAA
jgi:hypothetical protein